MASRILFACILLLSAFGSMKAADQDPLQDFCCADLNRTTSAINGIFPCKPANAVTAADFKSSALVNPGNTNNELGFSVTAATVFAFPGLNTLGVSSVRIDFAEGGLNPPHIHPRGTELFFLVQGTLYVGFVATTSNNNRLFAQVLHPGDVCVFPKALVHFQLNIGDTPAIGLSAFNTQNPGVSQVAQAVFASNPPIDDAVLEKAFQINPELVDKLRELIKQT